MDTKEPVRLRTRLLKNGDSSLYLDIYFEGVRRYEYLKLYLRPDTRENKAHNTNTWKLANTIKAKRIIELQDNRFGLNRSGNRNVDFISFLIDRGEKAQSHKRGAGDMALWASKLLKEFAKREVIPFKLIDKDFIVSFYTFLRRHPSKKGGLLSANSVRCIHQSVSAALNAAVKKGIISSNPMNLVDSSVKPSVQRAERPFLTIDELQRVYETDFYDHEYVKDIFLFGCFTGLRYSDIVSLRWKNIDFQSDGTVMLSFRQTKTEGLVSAPLPQEAIRLLPIRGLGDSLVFGEQLDNTTVNRQVKKLMAAAGIDKQITFHSSRHTYATMLLTLGADIYTVSKLLGHTNISTTQIYTEVVNKKKVEAVNLLPIFNKHGQ